DVARLRELVVTGVGGQDARVRLGERVAQALADKRAGDAEHVRTVLARHALSGVDKPVRGADEVVSLALLAARAQRDALEQAAQGLAAAWAGRARVRLLGPLAPYDFVDVLVQDGS